MRLRLMGMQMFFTIKSCLLNIARWIYRSLPIERKYKERIKHIFKKEKNYDFRREVLSPDLGSLHLFKKYDLFVPPSLSIGIKNKPAKLICFYLPQFHAIPENDSWWGKGFTEWTNVKSAQPQFEGHYQPRIPGELGYYNLLNTDVQRRQIELAKLYGIDGFCFYFYWFNGKTLLEQPVINYLNDKKLDLPFCLCWANENWTRRWDGLEHEILIKQDYSAEDDLALIQYLRQYISDPRYIKIDGKPLLIVYNPDLLPSAKETASRWRNWCSEIGIGEIYLAYTQSFSNVDPAHYGFDAAIEFPPNISHPPKVHGIIPYKDDYACIVYDWRIFIKRSENYLSPSYKLFRGVSPAWDNTARRKNESTIFVGNTPQLYKEWLKNAIVNTVKEKDNPEERLVFINAWNEWAEGAYLEPDERYGYAWLQATRDALFEAMRLTNTIVVVTHDCHPHGAQFLCLSIAQQLKVNGISVVILALEGGKLQEDFVKVGKFVNLSDYDEKQLVSLLNDLKAKGVSDAITSTVVAGSVVPILKKAGFCVLSLIHELPGVINDMGQKSNAKAIAEFADKIVFPAKLVRDGFCSIANVPEEKIVIRNQGLLRKNPYKNRREEARRAVCEKYKIPINSKIVLNVAYMDFRKGPDLFVEIAAEVIKRQKDAVFFWVGHSDQELEKKVTARIYELGLADRIIITGFDREPLALYAAASVYALTSREDPFPNVVLESAEVGVPIVAFEGAVGSADFILKCGGRLAKHLDTSDFACCVNELLTAEIEEIHYNVPSLQKYVLDLLHHLTGFFRVSVVVPNYNYEHHLKKRLESICHQSYPIYELILLDDASIDDSVSLINDYMKSYYGDYKVIINNVNSGCVTKQWRKGLTQCNGDIIWIAEADDFADHSFLEELVYAFQNINVVLTFSQSHQVNNHGKIIADDYLEYTNDISERWEECYLREGSKEIKSALCIKNTIPNVSAVLFKRDALEKAFESIGKELFDYHVAGDWLIYLHVLKQGKVFFNKKSLNYHRRHAKSVIGYTDAETHICEISQMQKIARDLASISSNKLQKAEIFIDKLHEYFGISTDNTK